MKFLLLFAVLLACGDHGSKLDVTEDRPPTMTVKSPLRKISFTPSFALRVMLCGTGATISGTSTSGTVTHPATTTCTIGFPTTSLTRSCSFGNGTLHDSNEYMVTAKSLIGTSLTYTCTP